MDTKHIRRISMLLLAAVLCVGLLPTSVFAAPDPTPIEYKITYYINGDDKAAIFTSGSVPEGTEYSIITAIPPSPYAGWQFAGWATSPDGLGREFPPFKVQEDRSFYATWFNPYGAIVSLSYRVDYDANGGKGSLPTDNNRYDSDSKVIVKTTPTPTRKGYEFDGWALTPKGKSVKSFIITGNTVLYAIWVTPKTDTTEKIDIKLGSDPGSGSGAGFGSTVNQATSGAKSDSAKNVKDAADDPDDSAASETTETTAIAEQETPLVQEIQSPLIRSEPTPNWAEFLPVIVTVVLTFAFFAFFLSERDRRKKHKQD